MTFKELNKIVADNNIPEDAELMSDSGRNVYDTEIDMVFYNPDTNILMLTKRWGNAYKYVEDCDWKLLYKEEEK